MSIDRDFHETGWADDPDGLAGLDRVRAACDVRVGPECLPPDVESELCEAFRVLAAHLEIEAWRRRRRKAA